MTFPEAEAFLYSFVNWERKGTRPTSPQDLARFRSFLQRLGDPQHAFRVVWVTGTNGKGSVCAMISSVLRECGWRVGLYTSPHLVSLTERIQVNGEPVGEDSFAQGVALLREVLGSEAQELEGYRTTFELLTALAFLTFRDRQVDVAVVEAGLGARLDATAVVEPCVSVITPIHLDHTHTLGRTLAAIAWDKAGVIRPGAALVTAPQPRAASVVIGREAVRVGPSVWKRVGRDSWYRGIPGPDGFWGLGFRDGSWRLRVEALPLRGAHQVVNGATALTAVRLLVPEASPDTVARGMAKACWPGRLEVVEGRPRLLVDGAHNPHGARALARFLSQWDYVRGRPRVGVVAISADKDAAAMFRAVASEVPQAFTCRVLEPRGADPGLLAQRAAEAGVRAVAMSTWEEALRAARAEAGDEGVVVVFGSLYLVGCLRRALTREATAAKA